MTTGVADALFVDTNVLVFSSVAQAPLHAAARDALQLIRGTGAELWISRQILREYLATLTRPQTFTHALPISDLSEDVRRFSTGFRVAEDSADVTDRLLWVLERVPTGGRQIHDANVVATMLAYRIRRLLTHNVEDFNRFNALITIVPLVGTP
jgi:predicted nucleic acid-binding protein